MKRYVFSLACLLACVVVRIEGSTAGSSHGRCRVVNRDCNGPCLCGKQKCDIEEECCRWRLKGWSVQRECTTHRRQATRCCDFRCENGGTPVRQKFGFDHIIDGILSPFLPKCELPRYRNRHRCQCPPGFSGGCCEKEDLHPCATVPCKKGSVCELQAVACVKYPCPSPRPVCVPRGSVTVTDDPTIATTSIYGAFTDDRTPDPSTDDPTPDPCTDDPTPDPSTEDPTFDPSTDHPTPDPSTDNPTPDPSTDDPTPDLSTDDPTPDPSTEDPTFDPSTNRPGSGDMGDDEDTGDDEDLPKDTPNNVLFR